VIHIPATGLPDQRFVMPGLNRIVPHPICVGRVER
jgi:hypothetical protein